MASVNSLFKKVIETAGDAGSLAKSLTEAGVRHVTTAVGGIKVFGSLHADTSEEVEADETHYFLLPYPGADSERPYVVFSKHVVPPGVGVTNSLPKARIFHLPDRSGRNKLEQELIASAARDSLPEDAGESDFADRLEAFAEQIDQQTGKVSGGLLLIGGAVAFANPLLGVGIAAKGLLPSVGAKASKAGASLIGDKLRAWSQSRSESRSRKEAEKSVRRLKPEIHENPLIQTLDALVTNEDSSADVYDPFLDRRNWVDEAEKFRFFEITVEAISEVYGDLVDDGGRGDDSLDPVCRSWIESLIDLRKPQP